MLDFIRRREVREQSWPEAGAALLLMVLSLCIFGACAKVADPLPPIVSVPPPLSNVQIRQVGGNQMELLLPLPSPDIRELEVFRVCDPARPPDSLPNRADPYARVGIEQLATLNGGSRVFHDPQPETNGFCGYWARVIDGRGKRSELTDVLHSAPLPVPAPPLAIRHELREDAIVLRWDPPEENIDGSRPPVVQGYLINSQRLVDTAEFVDTDFEFGREARYQIQTVGKRADPMVLSDPAADYSILPRDTFPPEAPANPAAVAVGGSIQLVWDEATETDLQGYYVYRGTESGRLQRLSKLVLVNRYTDDAARAGSTYFYRISAVDQSGNESPLSEIVSATVN